MAQLNEAQQAAVEHDQGPLLVLAGAGTGKTRVITQRIVRLLERGVRPDAILAVSFTNKAAEEMQQRLERATSRAVVQRLWLSTFHRFGMRLLGEDLPALWGPGQFVLFDQSDTLGLVRELAQRHRNQARSLDVAALAGRISSWKNRLVGVEQVTESDDEYDSTARALYAEYQEALRSMRAVDFDDLLLLPVRLLEQRPEVREKWQQRFRHLLIDEFQDTNHAQLTLVRLLVNALRNVCVVGDDDQSVYAFRGAEVSNILDFERHFSGAQVIKLEENYRSRAPILAVANAVIDHADKRYRKQLRASRGGGAPVQRFIVPDFDREAACIASEIRALRRDGVVPGNIAVLYRSNLQARRLEEELRIAGVPYRVWGGIQYFDRKEVKDALAYLRAVIYPRDELSLRRSLHVPPRGIGPSIMQRIDRYGMARGLAFAEALSHIDAIEGVPLAARQAVRDYLSALRRAAQEFRQQGKLTAAAKQLFDEVGLRQHLSSGTPGTSNQNKSMQRRQENIDFLLRCIERYEASHSDNDKSLAALLSRLALDPPREGDEQDQGRVLLSTLHGVKGLEFDVVFIAGCVEGQLPHNRSLMPKVSDVAPTAIEEERRLFYVGVTRARERLYLMVPEKRSLRGQTMPLVPSRFLTGLPADAIEERRYVAAQTTDFDDIADFSGQLIAQLQGGV